MRFQSRKEGDAMIFKVTLEFDLKVEIRETLISTIFLIYAYITSFSVNAPLIMLPFLQKMIV